MAALQGTVKMDINQHEKWIPAFICLALAVLTVVAFWPVKDAGFINLDDNVYVYENAYLQSGMSWDSIKQAFSFKLARKIGHWHPVTWFSWLLNYSLFGLDPFGYHLVNLLLHVINTILLFLILRRMTRALWPSAFVAVLFAIHPLHVESVAWITERKDVLSTFFMMLTLGAYSFYVENRDFKRYLFVLLFYILGLMSKSMLVTLPFVLLLLDYWPLGRFSKKKPAQKILGEALKPVILNKTKKKSKKNGGIKEIPEVRKTLEIQKPVEAEFQWSRIYPLVMEKVPLFALSILSSIAAYFAALETVTPVTVLSPFVRIGNAFVSYVTYIGKMSLPVNLAVFYPHPGNVILWQVTGAAILLITITVVVFLKVKSFPYLATGWLWYVGTLVPVIGIVQAGSQAMADRYAYISLIGLFIMVAWGLPKLLEKWPYRREILLVSSILVILCLSGMTKIQVGYWQDSIMLYDHTLKVTDNNWFIYNCRGGAYRILGNYKQAIEDFNSAIEIKPIFASAYYNRCSAYDKLGKYSQAIADCGKAIKLNPAYAEAYVDRGNAHIRLGNHSQAIADYERAIAIKPNDSSAYYNRGVAYSALGKYSQAIADYGRAIAIKSDHADAYNNRGAAYYIHGNYQMAIDDFGRAIGFKPDFAGAYNNRGIAYSRLGNNDLAINDLKTAAKLGDERAKNALRSKTINW